MPNLGVKLGSMLGVQLGSGGVSYQPILDLIAHFGVSRVVRASEAHPDTVTLTSDAVSGWAGLSGAHMEQGDSARRPAFNAADSDFGGLGSVAFTGANNHFLRSAAAAAAFSGTDKPFVHAMLCRFTGTPTDGFQSFWTACHTTNNVPHFQFRHNNTTGVHACLKRDDASSSNSRTTSETVNTSTVVYTVQHTGTSTFIRRNGVDIALNNATMDVGQMTVDVFVYAILFLNSVISQPGNLKICRDVIIDDAATGPGEIALIESKLAEGSGLSL